MMKQKLQQDFAKKIEEAYWMSPDKAQKQAEEVLARLPDCLIPNIREWIQGTILTDICIQDYSIPMLLAIWDSQDFLGAVQVMAELEENPAEALRKIWNMRSVPTPNMYWDLWKCGEMCWYAAFFRERLRYL